MFKIIIIFFNLIFFLLFCFDIFFLNQLFDMMQLNLTAQKTKNVFNSINALILIKNFSSAYRSSICQKIYSICPHSTTTENKIWSLKIFFEEFHSLKNPVFGSLEQGYQKPFKYVHIYIALKIKSLNRFKANILSFVLFFLIAHVLIQRTCSNLTM